MEPRNVFLAAILALIPAVAGAADLRVMSSNAMREALLELGPQFEKASGHKVTMTFVGSVDMMKRLRAGEGGADVVVLQASSVDALAAAGKVVVGVLYSDVSKIRTLAAFYHDVDPIASRKALRNGSQRQAAAR